MIAERKDEIMLNRLKEIVREAGEIFFQWGYMVLALYEEEDGIKTNWMLEQIRICTKLTAEGVIRTNRWFE